LNKNTIFFVRISFRTLYLYEEYQIVDNQAIESAYYRLLQMDFGGKLAYSTTIFVGSESGETLKLYPNPVQDKVNLQLSNASNNQLYLQLFDLNGTKLLEHQGSLLETQKSLNQALKNFPAGIYSLKLTDTKEQKLYKAKLVKQ